MGCVCREVIIQELQYRWVHVQPLARCISGQATSADNKDPKPPLQAFYNSEAILMTTLAIHNTVFGTKHLWMGGHSGAITIELLGAAENFEWSLAYGRANAQLGHGAFSIAADGVPIARSAKVETVGHHDWGGK